MSDNLGKLILRVTLGVLMLFHGISKVTHGVSFLEGMFTNAGLPASLAYGAYLGEVLAPLMLIIGYRVVLASILIIATMIGAIVLVHSNDIFALTSHGAWAIELQMFYIMAAVVVIFQGAGKYSIDGERY